MFSRAQGAFLDAVKSMQGSNVLTWSEDADLLDSDCKRNWGPDWRPMPIRP